MKRVVVLGLALMLVGCASAQMRTSHTHEMIDGQPIFKLLTEVCDSDGYACVTVDTYQRTEEGGLRLIDSQGVGGPGMAYAVGVGLTSGTGAAATGGLLSVWAAHERRPDTTHVTQKGASAVGVRGDVTGNSGVVEGGKGGAGGKGGSALAVSASEATAAQQQQQQMQQQTTVKQVSVPKVQPSKPETSKPPVKPKPVVVPKTQTQNQMLIVK